MHLFAPLPAICFALLAALAGVAQLGSAADDPDRASCRDQALAEGLRSEEVILDYIQECMQSRSAANETSAASGTEHRAEGAAQPPRQGSAADPN